jgi:hypothetical protein
VIQREEPRRGPGLLGHLGDDEFTSMLWLGVILYESTYARRREAPQEELAYSGSDHRRRRRRVDARSKYRSVANTSRELAEDTAGRRSGRKPAVIAQRYGSNGVDVFGRRVIVKVEPAGRARFFPPLLLGRRCSTNPRHVDAESIGAGAGQEDVGRVFEHAARQSNRVLDGRSSDSSTPAIRTIG